MTTETWKAMQLNDGVDTTEIQRLKHVFWSLENVSRPYPFTAANVTALQEDIEAIVAVLTVDAKANNRKPVNVTNPRIPLPPDSAGKLSNGRILGEILTAARNRTRQRGSLR